MTVAPLPAKVVWHDVECGAYTADLPLWRELAAASDGGILDVGAGTGRVSLDLARRGHAVTALDLDGDLLAELRSRAGELPVTTLTADATAFSAGERFGLVLVPMQTVQLLRGAEARAAFLRCARAALRPGGRLAIALAEYIEPFALDPGEPEPLPDMREIDGVVYLSVPVAVLAEPEHYVLERRRETTSVAGEHRVEADRITLHRLSAATLEREARRAGLVPEPRRRIAPTDEHCGSTVVILRA